MFVCVCFFKITCSNIAKNAYYIFVLDIHYTHSSRFKQSFSNKTIFYILRNIYHVNTMYTMYSVHIYIYILCIHTFPLVSQLLYLYVSVALAGARRVN